MSAMSGFMAFLVERPAQPASYRTASARTAGLAIVAALVLAVALVPRASADVLTTDFCDSGTLGPGSSSTDLVLANKTCNVDGTQAKYTYRYVNILQGGKLVFQDKSQQFYARSILVQAGGTLSASVGAAANRTLVIHLYGAPADPPITCKKITLVNNVKTAVDDLTCGVDNTIWTSNTFGAKNPATCNKSPVLPGGVLNECFYQYGKFIDTDPDGAYFGHKVLAVSFGGVLELFGSKGSSTGIDANPSNSGDSWARLNQTLLGSEMTIKLDRVVDWQENDQIVITSTDYLPGHAEQLTVQSVANDTTNNVSTVTLKGTAVQFPHNGARYDYSAVPFGLGPDPDPNFPAAIGKRYLETRAAVGLLTRSIRIVSDGETPDSAFTEAPSNYFGGHTVIRQGAFSVHIQGVEFFQLGQGGMKMHYPVHFHMARRVPDGFYVKDSSIHDSMTRWITVHATQGVTIARNVGYRSIGHGFYLEDGTETDNKFFTNLGVFARAAVYNDQNKRQVPGILARPLDVDAEVVPFHSDYDHPTIFWIMNGWNDFQYNFAAGAGTCGVCYWLLPGGISGGSQYEKWEGYAAQQTGGREGLTPLKSFVGNSCSTAMTSLLNIKSTTRCQGIADISDSQHLKPVPNANAPAAGDARAADYYPIMGELRNPTLCAAGQDCSNSTTNKPCSGTGADQANCTVTVIDRYTTSFNWATKNFSAIWLRPWWFLMTDSAVTDVQQGGLTFVTGGGYTRADAAIGFWDVVRKSLFIGNTQPNVTGTQFPVNPYAANAGPFNPSGLRCDARRGDYCLNAAQGITYPFEAFSVNQRLFNIYDGPAYQERNAYLDIKTTNIGTLNECKPGGVNHVGPCASADWMYGIETGVPQDVSTPSNPTCYLPNAAIGWKQSNGFYYPPAFHSGQLFFKNVDIRHFVIEPTFLPSASITIPHSAYQTDPVKAQARYCTWETGMFDNFTDVDRQTVLNDDDGSLTGLLGVVDSRPRETISVNQDEFFLAPKVTVECASDKHADAVDATKLPGTADTSPYEYVSTAIIDSCGIGEHPDPNKPPPAVLPNECGGTWQHDCGGPFCYGVPLYRLYITAAEAQQSPRPKPSIRMAGQGTGQRSTLTVNHGNYYIDSQVSQADQATRATSLNVFVADHTYYVWFIYATPTTQQTYTIFVGKNLPADKQSALLASIKPYRVDVSIGAYGFTSPTSGANFVTGSYDPASGIATIKTDLSTYASEFTGDLANFCRPASYCAIGSDNKCGCKAGSDCKDDGVCRWATKEIDCPTKGCFGFGIKLPSNFATGQALPPDPKLFTEDPTYATNWNIPWRRVYATVSGTQCHYEVDPN